MATVNIYDSRFERQKLVGVMSVPDSWTPDMILSRYGIREHLEVWREGERIQRGARKGAE